MTMNHSGGQICWRQAKHTKLHSELPQVSTKRNLRRVSGTPLRELLKTEFKQRGKKLNALPYRSPWPTSPDVRTRPGPVPLGP